MNISMGKLRAFCASWRKERRIRTAKKLFFQLIVDDPDGVERIVGGQAMRMACAMVMNWLDSRRIMHCRFCPNTDQLVRHGKDYLCPGHNNLLLVNAAAHPGENGKAALEPASGVGGGGDAG